MLLAIEATASRRDLSERDPRLEGDARIGEFAFAFRATPEWRVDHAISELEPPRKSGLIVEELVR